MVCSLHGNSNCTRLASVHFPRPVLYCICFFDRRACACFLGVQFAMKLTVKLTRLRSPIAWNV